MKKTYLFVDGSNLYGGQYKLFGPKKYLDFSRLIRTLEKQINVKFDKIHFYASYSPKPKKPTKKQELYLKNEGLFYKSVKETSNVIFSRGYRSKTSGKEKGVDVKLTAELITFAFLDKCDTIFLFSGDADFLPALLVVKKFLAQKTVILVCLENKLMYQGLFYFRTYVVCFENKLIVRRKLKSLNKIIIERFEVTKKIQYEK